MTGRKRRRNVIHVDFAVIAVVVVVALAFCGCRGWCYDDLLLLVLLVVVGGKRLLLCCIERVCKVVQRESEEMSE